MINFQHARLAADRDVQALVADLVVLHSGQHVDAVADQRGAVHPARGLAQAGADLGTLALQQMNLTHRVRCAKV